MILLFQYTSTAECCLTTASLDYQSKSKLKRLPKHLQKPPESFIVICSLLKAQGA